MGAIALDCKHIQQAAVYLDFTSTVRLFLNRTASLSRAFFNRAITLLSSAKPIPLPRTIYSCYFSVQGPSSQVHFLWQPFPENTKIWKAYPQIHLSLLEWCAGQCLVGSRECQPPKVVAHGSPNWLVSLTMIPWEGSLVPENAAHNPHTWRLLFRTQSLPSPVMDIIKCRLSQLIMLLTASYTL